MRVPRLNHRVDVFKPVTSRDSTGAVKPLQFKLWRRVYSRFTYRQGNDQTRDGADQRTPVVPASIIQRKQGCCNAFPSCDQVQPDMRIQYAGYWWDIKTIVPYNANPEFVEILVERGGFHNKPNNQRPVV